MNRHRIEALTLLLSADAGMFAAGRPPGAAPPSLAERLAIAVNDPGFGYKFVMDFVTRCEPLPPAVHESWLRRAHSHHAGANVVPDCVMLAVEQLVSPVNEFTRHILNALLICRDCTYAQIAEHLGLDADTLRCYEQLHFDVRDHAGEAAYISRLVFPEGRFPTLATDGMEELPVAQRLLIAGYTHGAREVLWLAGMTIDQDPPSTERSLKEFESALLSNALQLARNGALNSKTAPGIGHAKTLLAAQRNNNSSKQVSHALPDISIDRAILMSMGADEEAVKLESAIAEIEAMAKLVQEEGWGKA